MTFVSRQGFSQVIFAVLACMSCAYRQDPAPIHSGVAEAAARTPAPKTPIAEPADFASGNANVRIRLAQGASDIQITAGDRLRILEGAKTRELPAGAYRVHLEKATRPRVQYWVFVKTFRPNETAECNAYIAEWKARSVSAETVMLGNRFRTKTGTILDCREKWVSVGHFATKAEAESLQKRLEAESVWGWVRARVVAVGDGHATISGEGSPTTITLPCSIRAGRPIAARIANPSFSGSFSGTVELGIGEDGRIEVFETLPIEDYLMGVLPSEMPAGWPADALKAQAVAARSDVLEHMGIKHAMEGFSFTNGESDRVYGGFGGRSLATDRAVRETATQVLVAGSRIVPATFSADCGGCTEANDTVWSAPPDSSLRSVSDFANGATPGTTDASLRAWLARRDGANCSADANGFRWTKRIAAGELTRLVNANYSVGTVRDIKLGDRGPGGRLKWIRIIGSQHEVTVRKESVIRQAFGGLPSALFIIDVERKSGKPGAFVFRGAGRGHGVGMCQYGARGLAMRGAGYRNILSHYFSGAVVDSVE